MRRRERYQGLVWLEALSRDPEDKLLVPIGAQFHRVGGLMDKLVHHWGRLVEAEYAAGYYTVRTIPKSREDVLAHPFVAASYKGADLRSILLQAVTDLEAMSNPHETPLYNAREVQRWVG